MSLNFLNIALTRKKRIFLRGLRRDDIFLVGHPKSGNTLVAYILAMILTNGDHKSVNLKNLSNFIPIVHRDESQIHDFNHFVSPRIFRNEIPTFPELYPKTIYLIRDPRAVLVSYFHHYCAVKPLPRVGMKEFIKSYLRGSLYEFEPDIKRWDKQTEEWLDRKNRQAVVVVRYESLIENKENTIRNIFKEFDIQFSEERLDLALEKSDFRKMRDLEVKLGAESYPDKQDPKEFFIRKGIIDSWRQELEPRLCKLIEDEFGKQMRILGYL